MHVAFFCQHYHTPDNATAARPYSLVRRLARRHEVTLLTTRAWHDRRLTRDFDWTPPGVRCVMIDVPYDNGMNAPRRLQAFASYAARAVRHGLRLPRPDLIYATSTPLSAVAAGATVAGLRGVPWLFEVRDLWPDFPVQMNALPNRWVRRALYRLERSLYRRADHVVTLSRDMERHVRRFRPDTSGITTVEYGTPFDLLDRITPADRAALRRTYDLEGRHLVLYAGTFGRANAIGTLLAAARQLRARRDICFVFAGCGHHADDVAEAARTEPNVRRLPPQPLLRALALFQMADLALVSFIDRPVLAANSPAKLYDSLAAGTPVVVTNPGWTQALVEEHGCGWYVPAEHPAALAGRIARAIDHPEERRRAGARAAMLARERFDRTAHMERLVGLIEAVARGQKPAPPVSVPAAACPR